MHGAVEKASELNTVRPRFAYLVLIASSAALGGLLFGYDWVVIGGAKPFYERYFSLTSAVQIGWATSCALLGCLFGSITSGALADRFGRKALLVAAGALFAISSVGTGLAEDFAWFVAWRIAGGIAIGIASIISPVYIAEISPPAWRGRLVTLNQLAIVIGILLAQIVNWQIARPVLLGATEATLQVSWNVQWGWRWMFFAVAVPSICFLVASLLIPESPRWLAERGAREQARAVFRRIGGDPYLEEHLATLVEIAENSEEAHRNQGPLRSPNVRSAILIGSILAVLQQWSGINVIFNYADGIYRGAGFAIDDILFNIVISGAINFLFSLVALVTVDHVGRRPLMLIGCAGLTICHFLIGLAFFANVTGFAVVGLTLAAIAIYALSLAPVTWVLISEIFPTAIRARGVSIAVSALWIACFGVTFLFPVMKAGLGPAGTFWTYGVICFLGFLFVARSVPELRGRPI